jgi:DNA-binding CsgD family transcriptional regulator
MDKVLCRRLIQVSAWLALFAGLLILYLGCVIFDFRPQSPIGKWALIDLITHAGMLLGTVFCPLFLPLPGLRAEKIGASFGFIFPAVLPNIVIHRLGVSFMLGSFPAQVLMTVSTGMVQTMSYGLFYLTQLPGALPSNGINVVDGGAKRWWPRGSFLLGSALTAIVFTLLAFRILFPGLPLLARSVPEPSNYRLDSQWLDGQRLDGHSMDTSFRGYGLSDREAEIARLIITEGLSNQQIAERILRSKFTVEKHITSIYRKCGVRDRAACVAKVLR